MVIVLLLVDWCEEIVSYIFFFVVPPLTTMKACLSSFYFYCIRTCMVLSIRVQKQPILVYTMKWKGKKLFFSSSLCIHDEFPNLRDSGFRHFTLWRVESSFHIVWEPLCHFVLCCIFGIGDIFWRRDGGRKWNNSKVVDDFIFEIEMELISVSWLIFIFEISTSNACKY